MQTTAMRARISNPAMIVPGAMEALLALGTSVKNGGVPSRTLDLAYLRASQINGCSVCVDMHARDARKAGETDERLFAVAALILSIATVNLWNRINATTRQVAGEWIC